MFADTARIYVKSGKGGDGHVSFRRELYVPNGGPDGGDGGKGGDIIFVVDPGLNTLEDFRNRRKYIAPPGEDGKRRRMHGKNGEDLLISVPEGTIIRDDESKKIIVDLSGDNRRFTLLKGGKGGLGNMHFATSSMQAPRYAKPGQEAMDRWLTLELRVIADVGLIGFPNVGKSSILSMCSNARPEIANYHFTTLNPHLGVVTLDGDRRFVMADIPGLIKGASEGVGLGHEFLRHVSRCRLLLHVVDLSGSEGRDPIEDVKIINEELSIYDSALLKKPMLIAANKVDLVSGGIGSLETLMSLKELYEGQGIPVVPISASTGEGISELLKALEKMLDKYEDKTVQYESEFDIEDLKHREELPINYSHPAEGEFSVDGPKIEKMLGYTNLEAEKGFQFFQKFMINEGVISTLKTMGLKEGDTIHVYGHDFEYLDTE